MAETSIQSIYILDCVIRRRPSIDQVHGHNFFFFLYICCVHATDFAWTYYTYHVRIWLCVCYAYNYTVHWFNDIIFSCFCSGIAMEKRFFTQTNSCTLGAYRPPRRMIELKCTECYYCSYCSTIVNVKSSRNRVFADASHPAKRAKTTGW